VLVAADERNRTEREVLLEAGDRPLESLGELSERCLPTLAARLWGTCCWPATMNDGWKIGDRNFLVAEVSPDPETSLYVQFWSEPQDPVIAEVSSGEWNPGAIKYVRSRQREELEALGFTIGPKSSNFRKEVEIRTSAEAEKAAQEVLGIFYSVFGYRGQWPLRVQWHQGERADHEPVYSAVSLRDLAKIAAHLGFEVSSLAPNEAALQLKMERRVFRARLDGRVGRGSLHSVVVLEAPLAPAGEVDGATVEALGDALRFARVSRAGRPALTLTMPLPLDGGVTVPWLAEALRRWFGEWRTCRRLLRGRRGRGKARRAKRCANGPALH
jgi:hypothetical protein